MIIMPPSPKMGFLVLKVLKYGLQPRVSIPQYLKVYDGKQTDTETDIATNRPNRPRGWLRENLISV